MISNLYSLRDNISEVYSPPFPANTDAQAIRTIHQAVMKGQGSIGLFPEHYHLYKVGTFDDNVGKFKNITNDLVAQCASMKPAELQTQTEE